MILRNLGVIGSVITAGGGNYNVYKTGFGSSLALVHIVVQDSLNLNKQGTDEKPKKISIYPKIVVDMIHRLTDSFRVERISVIEN
jgi:hypothetical protein